MYFNKNKLPTEYQLLVNWILWTEYDMRKTLSTETYFKYIPLQEWLTDELHSWFNVSVFEGINFNPRSHFKFWFEFERLFDKSTLVNISCDKSYTIKKLYRGYSLIEDK